MLLGSNSNILAMMKYLWAVFGISFSTFVNLQYIYNLPRNIAIISKKDTYSLGTYIRVETFGRSLYFSILQVAPITKLSFYPMADQTICTGNLAEDLFLESTHKRIQNRASKDID